jgi:hypothetical protein
LCVCLRLWWWCCRNYFDSAHCAPLLVAPSLLGFPSLLLLFPRVRRGFLPFFFFPACSSPFFSRSAAMCFALGGWAALVVHTVGNSVVHTVRESVVIDAVSYIILKERKPFCKPCL